MKKEIATLFLMTSVWAAQAQGTFTIEGQVKNVEDGALITLFRATSLPLFSVCWLYTL